MSETALLYDYPYTVVPGQQSLPVTGQYEGSDTVHAFELPPLAFLDQPAVLREHLAGRRCFGTVTPPHQVIFVYTAAGAVETVHVFRQGRWLSTSLQKAASQTYGVELRFLTARAQQTFVFLLAQVQAGEVALPTLQLCLSQLAAPPVVQEVSGE